MDDYQSIMSARSAINSIVGSNSSRNRLASIVFVFFLGIGLVTLGIVFSRLTREEKEEVKAVGDIIFTVHDTGARDRGAGASMVLGADGLPTISFGHNGLDGTDYRLKVLKCSSFSCTSGNIFTVESAGSTSLGTQSSIGIGTDGNPVISYFVASAFNDLRVAKCGDASCSSDNSITTVDSEGLVGNYSSLVIGNDGNPVISYQDYTNKAMKVVTCGNPSCSSGNAITSVDVSEDQGMATSSDIVIGSDGKPIIAYSEEGDWCVEEPEEYCGSSTRLKVASCGNVTCTSDNEVNVVVPYEVVPYENEYHVYNISMALGSDGKPIISYEYWDAEISEADLKVLKCGNSSCTSGNITTVIDDTYGGKSFISINNEGIPFVVYYDHASPPALNLVECGNESCSSGNIKVEIDPAVNEPVYEKGSPIVFGGDGSLTITYANFTQTYAQNDTKGLLTAHITSSFVLNLPSSLDVIKTQTQNSVKSGSDYGVPSYHSSIELRVKKSTENLVIADLNVDMSSDRNWSNLTADASSQKSLFYYPGGFSSMPGATGSGFSLYVPIPTGGESDSVVICPDAATLSEVTEACSGAITKTESDPDTSKVTIDSQLYWRVEGLTSTGGITLLYSPSPTTTTTTSTTTTTTVSTTTTTTTITPTDNVSPLISILEPNGEDDLAFDIFTIQWVDSDPDNNASISLYYDEDDHGQDGNLIASGIKEDSSNDFIWDISGLEVGSYFIYAIIDDSVNPSVVDYSEGPLTKISSSCEEANSDKDPTNEDTDCDGIPDIWEDQYDCLSSSILDADGDLLTNISEYKNNTNPCKKDTDGDGLSDYIEVNSNYEGRKTDPNNADTDGDGYSDGEEDKNRNGKLDEGESNPTEIEVTLPETGESKWEGIREALSRNNGALLIGGSICVTFPLLLLLIFLLFRKRKKKQDKKQEKSVSKKGKVAKGATITKEVLPRSPLAEKELPTKIEVKTRKKKGKVEKSKRKKDTKKSPNDTQTEVLPRSPLA